MAAVQGAVKNNWLVGLLLGGATLIFLLALPVWVDGMMETDSEKQQRVEERYCPSLDGIECHVASAIERPSGYWSVITQLIDRKNNSVCYVTYEKELVTHTNCHPIEYGG